MSHTGVGSTLAKLDGWSKSGQLRVQESDSSVTLQADFDRSDVYSIQIAADPPVGGVFRAVATITWSVQGNPVVRQIDVGNGSSISGPGQAVRVEVRDATSPLATFGPMSQSPKGQKYGITISVSRGVRPTSAEGPVLEGVNPNGDTDAFTIAPSGSALYLVPQNAGAIAFKVFARTTGLVADSTNLIIQSENASQVFNRFSYIAPSSDPDWQPLAPNANEIAIINLDKVGVDVDVLFAIQG